MIYTPKYTNILHDKTYRRQGNTYSWLAEGPSRTRICWQNQRWPAASDTTQHCSLPSHTASTVNMSTFMSAQHYPNEHLNNGYCLSARLKDIFPKDIVDLRLTSPVSKIQSLHANEFSTYLTYCASNQTKHPTVKKSRKQNFDTP